MSSRRRRALEDHGLDLGQAAGARRSLEHLGAILGPGEEALCGAQAFLEGRPGLVVATSARLLFVYRDEAPIDTPYERITRYRAKVGVVASDLEIEDDRGVARIRQIHPRDRLAALARILQKGPRPATAPAGPEPMGSEAGRRVVVPLPLADQLLPGEWVVATFDDLTATTEGHERQASASAAVTNRRLLLLTPSGTPVEAWPLPAVEVEESLEGGRARLVGGIDLEFASSELAAGFSEAMREAAASRPG